MSLCAVIFFGYTTNHQLQLCICEHKNSSVLSDAPAFLIPHLLVHLWHLRGIGLGSACLAQINGIHSLSASDSSMMANR